jgi:hypothetical protein
MHPHELEATEQVLEGANHGVDGSSDPLHMLINEPKLLFGGLVILPYPGV